MKLLYLLFLHGFFVGFSCSSGARNLEDSISVCPLDMERLREVVSKYATALRFTEIQSECKSLLQGFRIVRADYLSRTGSFTFPANESASCWDAYESLVDGYVKSFGVRVTCGVQDQWISDSCLNISTKSQFEALISKPELQEITSQCNQDLNDNSSCATCVASLSRIESAYFEVSGSSDNVSDCDGFPEMYAAAFATRFGPFDLGTIKCLFSVFNTSDPRISDIKHNTGHRGVLIGSVIASLVGIIVVIWLFWWLMTNHCWRRGGVHSEKTANAEELASGFEMLTEGITLLRFSIEELRLATANFSRENLIGRGGYGNVFKGILKDGSEVALKRFKNCSVSGEEIFAHEVQVIASVRHVNLVALRGYCTVTTPLEGHQRIIVCDYIRNGSLHDHLFSDMMTAEKLSWPIRRKIALGIARGLAYLHNGVTPPIIHRDVKASNILLDEAFEPKLADFGLAKFTPDGFSHVSTRVAGTLGYVCPEYALYGRLSEKSDVYSFGVVFLELLSGKKAVISFSNNQAELLTDLAWSLVKQGRAMDILDGNLLSDQTEYSHEMEKHLVAAILSVHPLLNARPTMNHIVNMLESDQLGIVPPLSSIPDFAYATETAEIHRLLSSPRTDTTFSSQSQDYASGSRESEEAPLTSTDHCIREL
ncbi:OLC1v1000609C1 [Oldenlandia corymbosa var. corymbosa]|uniref:non-specific serine/threonine protein kinase n=1 Tax=Oldenlandia corymbosa var. corymbosa TaxID=529605 RepID=A0AAV1D439_OLDCO|nr:OLC1v1000609C1 [Oldenlandia corymbosa var. corymbosa]